jgi:peptidyl-prolyl cis-trans isomerase C
MTPSPEVSNSAKARAGITAFARDPLAHFLVLGGLLFAGASALDAMSQPVVRITQGDVEQIAASWQAMTMNPPSEEEMKGLLRERIDEEILAREAHRLGLDEDDVVIRRRLAQKMSFISDDVAVVMPATEADLLAFFESRKDRFRLPERYTWRHVVFSAERPGDSERSAAEAALRSAPAGEDPAGDPSLVPGTFSEASREAIVGEFGESFYRALASARESQWTGPVMSPFGAHLIRLESRIPASEPSYDAVREQVREAWLSEERDKRNSEMREEIRRRYRIEFDAGVPRP